jgi:glycosyltransferase involved in cell wall biosynthesis
MTDFDCVYVSATSGIHDKRWVQALVDLGHKPAVFSLDASSSLDALISSVETAAGSSLPVLAGPLTTVTQHLVAQAPELNVVGLSWGFDLFELLAHGELSWLHNLSGLVIDSEPTQLIATSAGVPIERLTYIPWGIDLLAFTPVGPTISLSTLGWGDSSRMLLSLRAHEELYRVGDILEAFADVASTDPSVMLVIGHSGSLTATLRARVSELQLDDRVRFIGTITEAELPAWLRAAACYVTASEVDGTSVTLLQAMACETPIVASETPGNLGWIEDGKTGSTFTTGSIPSLTSALMTVLSSDTEPSSARARALVLEKADWSMNIHRLETAVFLS